MPKKHVRKSKDLRSPPRALLAEMLDVMLDAAKWRFEPPKGDSNHPKEPLFSVIRRFEILPLLALWGTESESVSVSVSVPKKPLVISFEL